MNVRKTCIDQTIKAAGLRWSTTDLGPQAWNEPGQNLMACRTPCSTPRYTCGFPLLESCYLIGRDCPDPCPSNYFNQRSVPPHRLYALHPAALPNGPPQDKSRAVFRREAGPAREPRFCQFATAK